LATDVEQCWRDWLRRRLAGEPVAYLVGGHEFHGLWLQVNAHVLDPRPDTETLVDWALAELADTPGQRVLDLGTGSGAIALAIKHTRQHAEVHAVERSPEALEVARSNGQRLGLEVTWHQGSWWQALAGGPGDVAGDLLGDVPDDVSVDVSVAAPAASRRFDLIVSNPPYIADTDEHLAALVHEPRQALVAGADGLDDLRLLVAGAGAWLRPGGHLLLEHGHDQAAAVAALMQTQPADVGSWVDIRHRADLAGHLRCTGARWRPADSA
jgi:release factor glutamine methyltransferase